MALSHMNFSSNSNDNQQRHMGYASTSSSGSINSGSGHFRQAPRSSATELTANKEKGHHASRPKFTTLKGKSWSAFTDAYGCETSDDESSDGDTTDDDPLIASTQKKRSSKGSVVKLKYKDRPLYGTCPETDAFKIVTCRQCRMVLKFQSLRGHLERHDKDKKHEHSSDTSPIKHERFEKSSTSEKTISMTEKLDKISVVSEKYEKIPHMIVDEKLADEKRQRSFLKKPIAATVTSSSSSSSSASMVPESSLNTLKYEALSSSVHDYSNSITTQRRRKRKHEEVDKQQQPPPPTFPKATITSIQPTASAPCRTIAILEQPSFIPMAHTSSPPPLAPITSKSNDPHTSVVLKITNIMPTATVIDGSFLVQPLEQDEAEIDLKELKILKPIVKDALSSNDHQTHLTSSNFFAGQPKPLAMNTFNLKKINAQSYVMSTQRKLVEFSRNLNLKAEEKVVTSKIQATPKTWSFIERSQVFTLPNPIFTRITH